MKKIVKPINWARKGACIYKTKSGVILIEVMIAIVIGLLLLNILIELYLSNQKSLRLQTVLYTIQANARSIQSILTDEIHHAGMIGCARLTNGFPITAYGEYNLTVSNKITGNTRNELTVRYAEYPNVTLTESMHDDNRITTNAGIHFTAGDILLISNCKRAEIFMAKQVKSKYGLQLITPSTLHNKYEKFSEVSRLKINKFTIAKTRRGNFALFIEDIKHNKTELVADIEHINISYTINNKGHLADVLADEVTDWADVLGVAIDAEFNIPPVKKNWHMYSFIQR